MKYKTIYFKDGKLRLIDQTLLPSKVEYIECNTQFNVYEVICEMKVRGAPAIGIAAAYGMVLSLTGLIKPNGADPQNWDEVIEELERVRAFLNSSRPTAVNLKWATSRMLTFAKDAVQGWPFEISHLKKKLIEEADRICEEDADSCETIGRYGEPLIKDGMRILTHCNAGSLATYELGTALAPMYLAFKNGKKFNVYVDETRPLLQGARLTSWELQEAGLEPILITDNCAAKLMADEKIDLVIVGADRVAVNGDVANKIGTYGLAVLCKYHKIPFYVAAPASTFDFHTKQGCDIPIENRKDEEVTSIRGVQIAPNGVKVYNPAFDVTPAELITGIITDLGIISPVDEETVEKCFAY
jgi:methylthioribose-1-phosphate isomerase